jgi:hypothetical protein
MDSGFTTVVKPAITVDTTAYADGDDIFGKLSVPVARTAGGSGFLTRLQVRTRTLPTVGMFLHVFDENPTASTFTRNAATVLHANDVGKVLKTFSILAADWVAPKGVNPWYTVELLGPTATMLSLAFSLASGAALFMAGEIDGAITWGGADYLGLVVTSETN